MNKLKYCLIGDDTGDKHVDPTKDEAQLSGLFLWSRAFNLYGKSGEIRPIWRKNDLEKYDIIHINYTPSNIQLPTIIRNELGVNSSTKLVINIDMDVHYWGVNFSHQITNVMNELKMADVLFHVEPMGADVLGHILDRKVNTLQHPVDVTNIFNYMKKERQPVIGTIFHRYFPNTIIPFAAQKNIPLRRILFGFTQEKKEKRLVSNAGMFDQILQFQQFKDNLDEMSKCLMACDLYEGYTYGRTLIELAALGVPTVCSSTISSAKTIFPFTSVDPFNVREAERIFIKLYEDGEFCDRVILHANKHCSQYSLKNAYKGFIEMIESY